MAKAKRKAAVHKLYDRYSAFYRDAECGLDLMVVPTKAFHITWCGVTCKNCLRHKPKRKGE